jgi:hypothetical protein
MLRRSACLRSLLASSLAAALLFAASADAYWLGTGEYQISLLVDGSVVHPIESVDEIEPGDVGYVVVIGDSTPPPTNRSPAK